ncbi:MAG TPA: DUF5946 family protein [Gemmatimonadaceae bacterium]|nr:DUF5946 family protein [Gemmatimonadaceae bacterium]
MTSTCPECGAALHEESSCQDYLHELLFLEAQVPGAPGAEPHFLAVASFNLQHPSAFLPSALMGLRRAVADVLAERATLDDARRRARHGARGQARVHHRADAVLSNDDQVMLRAWPTSWPITVLDVCRVPPDRYVESVRAWAASIIEALNASSERA